MHRGTHAYTGTGVQVAVPNGASDRILLTFQTLTPEASSHVLRNRAERQEARARAGRIRRAAKEAKEAKSKVCTLKKNVGLAFAVSWCTGTRTSMRCLKYANALRCRDEKFQCVAC